MKKLIALSVAILTIGTLLTGCGDPSLELTKRADIIKTNPAISEKYGRFVFEENDELPPFGVTGIILHFQNGDIEVEDDGTSVDFHPSQAK